MHEHHGGQMVSLGSGIGSEELGLCSKKLLMAT